MKMLNRRQRRHHHPGRFTFVEAEPRRRVGLIEITYRRLTSPAAAFLLLFPTIGYYTLSAYANVLSPTASLGGILIRVVSLAVLLIAWVSVSSREKNPVMNGLLLPASIFILLYGYRLIENMLFQGLFIAPGNSLILLIFFLSSILPAYLLASVGNSIRDSDMTPLLSLFAALFVVGMALNRDALTLTADNRMMLDKVNPIALAYVASSLMLFYLLRFASSKRALMEAVLLLPLLLLITSLARSRGMIIATGITLLIYVLALKGTRRIWALLGLGSCAAAVGLYANPEYLGYIIEALARIDTANDMSTAGRVFLFQGAWKQFLADPVLGRYAFELYTGYYPHNIYLESLMSVGVVGTLPFVIHIGMALRASIGLIREPTSSFTRLFVALLFIRDAIGAAASGGLWSVSGFWITSFLAIVMWDSDKRARSLVTRIQRNHRRV